MKKSIVLICLLFCTLWLSGCGETGYSLSDGIYRAQTNSLVYISFDLEEQTFLFSHNSLMSYLPSGEMVCRDGKVYATDGEDTYVFEIVDDETLSFLADESAETSLEEGMVFQLCETD